MAKYKQVTVRSVTNADTHVSLKELLEQRVEILYRINSVANLCNVGACYHDSCNSKFRKAAVRSTGNLSEDRN